MNLNPSPVVVVTGAVGNLGRAVAQAFFRKGAHTVLLDRSADRLHREYPELVVSPDHLLLAGIDLTDEASVNAAISSAVERFGHIDVLVNTVGAWRGGQATHKAPLADWEFLHNANVLPTLLTSRAVASYFVNQGHGKIINVAARSGIVADGGSAAYSAAKSAVLRLTEAMSAELKASGVNVNSVLPSTLDTPQNRTAMPAADPTKWVHPDAVADVVLFLASDAARAVHGAAIPVYGLS
jgi:NAD(P)-dependent dehydrogenase (short-subunit alcohol dehydrogenase family)